MILTIKIIDNDIVGIYKDKNLWGTLVHPNLFDTTEIRQHLYNGTELQCELKVENYDE